MQANYVKYNSTSGGNGCPNCSYFRNDPYGYDILKSGDYTNTGFDRGHLVPNADYGYDTYIINNAVPMNPSFNRIDGSWYISEICIRERYARYEIYEGCDYSDQYIVTSLDNKLYIPVGCYYVVLNDMNHLEDYGYYLNEAGSPKESKLPYWISC